MHIIFLLLALVMVVNIFLAIIVLFQEGREASSSWAWLLAVLCLPIFGSLLYFIFGLNPCRSGLFQWNDRKNIISQKKVRTQLAKLRSGQFHLRNQATRNSRDLIYMHLINNHALLSEDNTVELFTDGKEKFTQLFKDIEESIDHIHLQYYIIKKDQLGKKLIEVLIKKAKEGVKIRVLYDGFGSRGLNKQFFKELRDAGGEVAVFFPSIFQFINLRLNYRNHRKLVIVDGKTGYLGGFNVGNEYLGLDPKFGYWRDLHIRVQGTTVHDIQSRFILDWNQASNAHKIPYKPNYFPVPISNGDVGMQIVTSGPDSNCEHIKNGYIKMISIAKKSVLIQTPYLIPDKSLLDALLIACFSGLEVKIMIPNKPDHMGIYWATFCFIGQLLKAGAKVFIYENGFIHAKTLVVDKEISSIGSANFDVRSFKLNFEVNAFLYDEEIAQSLTKAFMEDVKVSRELTLNQYQKRPRLVRFKESIFKLLSPIL